MDDSKIIELFWNRSEEAISETDKKYGKYCYYIAKNILNSGEDAEECVNDSYLRAWNSIPPKSPERLQTYLGKIVRNLSLNKLERMNAEKRGGGQTQIILEELAECVPLDSRADSITDTMLIKDVLDRFLDTLPKESRMIFVRRYWYLASIKEIAKEYGISEGKTAVALSRTRKKLRAELEKAGIQI